MSTPDPERFKIKLEALRGFGWRTPPVQRFKLALKALGRRYGLVCTECRPGKPSEPPRST